MRALQVLVLAVILHIASPEPAHAYIDPSAGSMIIQIALGLVLGSLLTMRSWWTKLGQGPKLLWRKIRRS